MEPELKCQNELLEQLKDLKIENETLEKYVFYVNQCITIEELKKKIADLEKKKKMINLLENLMIKLHNQIEPLNDLKMVLETKKLLENEINQSQPTFFDESKPTKSNDFKFEIDHTNVDILKTLPVSRILSSLSSQNIPIELSQVDLISTQKLCANLTNLVRMSPSTYSMSINDESLNETKQLFDQNDIITNQEKLNFLENHLKTQSDHRGLITSNSPTMDVVNNISDEETAFEASSYTATTSMSRRNAKLARTRSPCTSPAAQTSSPAAQTSSPAAQTPSPATAVARSPPSTARTGRPTEPRRKARRARTRDPSPVIRTPPSPAAVARALPAVTRPRRQVPTTPSVRAYASSRTSALVVWNTAGADVGPPVHRYELYVCVETPETPTSPAAWRVLAKRRRRPQPLPVYANVSRLPPHRHVCFAVVLEDVHGTWGPYGMAHVWL